MSKSDPPTSGGVELPDDFIERLAVEAESGYDVERLQARPRRVRPTLSPSVDLACLDAVHLPVVLPGEELPDAVSGALHYRPDATAIAALRVTAEPPSAERTAALGAATNEWYALRREHWRVAATDLWRRGAGLTVSTVFNGSDLSLCDGATPLIYETMIRRFNLPDVGHVGGGWDRHCWRYATCQAALHGHAMVVGALRDDGWLDAL